MTLQIKFPVKQQRLRRSPAEPRAEAQARSVREWREQKPLMSSARIMMEVRRRLWVQVCAPETDAIQINKLLQRIEALTRRIEKRVEIQPLQAREVKTLEKLFDGKAFPGDEGAMMGMSY